MIWSLLSLPVGLTWLVMDGIFLSCDHGVHMSFFSWVWGNNGCTSITASPRASAWLYNVYTHIRKHEWITNVDIVELVSDDGIHWHVIETRKSPNRLKILMCKGLAERENYISTRIFFFSARSSGNRIGKDITRQK